MSKLPSEEQIALSKVRIERAKECITEADVLLQAGQFKGVANRSYYAVFHAMRAVLALDNFDSKKHSGVIAEFRRCYIKTGIFPAAFSVIISELFDIRTDSDYDDFYLIDKKDACRQLDNAEEFVSEVESYLISV